MAQYVFSMKRLNKTVPPQRQILKNINLAFFPGAKIGVLGLNGSGKSTVLRIMAGEDKNFDGDATPMPNLSIGYLPQEPQLDPEKSVREIVAQSGVGRLWIMLGLQLSFINANELLSFAGFLAETIVGDPVEPGGKTRFPAKAAEVLVSAQKRLLREIVRERNIAADELAKQTSHA